MSGKHMALVVHGERADRPDFRHLVNWVRDKGHLVEPYFTFDAGSIAGMRKFADFRPRHARFVGDGFSYEGEFLMFAVGLAQSSGGGNLVTPMASITDGLLDLCIVEGMSRAEFARTAFKVKRGEHVG